MFAALTPTSLRREFISEDPESIREPKSFQEDPMSRAIPRALAYYSRMRENAYILEFEDPEVLRSLWKEGDALFSLHGVFFVFSRRHQEREYISL